MSRYGRYGGGKRAGPREGRYRGCCEDCEAMGLARRLGDGYSACVMAASAHTVRSRRQRGREVEGRRGGRVSVWAKFSVSSRGTFRLAPQPSSGARSSLLRCCPSSRRPSPTPSPPALGCHFAHNHERARWRISLPLSRHFSGESGRSREITGEFEPEPNGQPRAALGRPAAGRTAEWARGLALSVWRPAGWFLFSRSSFGRGL